MIKTTILALDSATDACSVALWRDGSLAAHRFEARRHGQAEILMPMVRDVMQESAQEFKTLDGIATTVGPGGFTGLRIGLASARAMALAAGVPIVGLTTLEVVAAAQPERSGPLLVAIDSRRSDVYVQLFSPEREPASLPMAIMPGLVESILPGGPIVVAGNAAETVLQALQQTDVSLSNGPALPDAAVLARIVASCIAPFQTDLEPPAPLYLRPPDAKLPIEKQA